VQLATATLTRVKVAARRDFFVKSLLRFCKFLVNPNFDLQTNYIIRKPTNRRFPAIYCPYGNIINFSHTKHKNTLKNGTEITRCAADESAVGGRRPVVI